MMKRSYKIFLFCFFCLLLLGCDRATKDLAKTYLMNRDPVSWLHDSLRLEYAENTGAFLSFGDNWPAPVSFWVLGIIPLAFLAAFLVYAFRKSREMSLLNLLPFMLIFSGGAGNILDRLLYKRHVIDFMNLGFHNLRTGIFNFADLYVTTGVLFFLFIKPKKPLLENAA